MEEAHIDYETYGTIDLTLVGPQAYARHKNTGVWCAAWSIGRSKPKLWLKGQPMPLRLRRHAENGGVFVAHNAGFEYPITKYILTKKCGWCDIPIEQWRCSAAMARAMGLPSGLDRLTVIMQSPFKKDMEGHKAMMKLCRPITFENGKPIFHDPENPKDKPTFKTLYKYCIADLRAERWLTTKLHPLSPSELLTFHQDMLINERGVTVDLKFVERCCVISSRAKDDADKRIREITNDKIQRHTLNKQIVNWINEHGVKCTSIAKEAAQAILESENTPAPVRLLLEARGDTAKTSVAKYYAMRARADRLGRIRDCYIMNVAITGRWGGSGPQLHNLPRQSHKWILEALEAIRDEQWSVEALHAFFGPLMPILSQCLRSSIVAKKDHILVGADYNAIEARVLAWLAGQQDLVNAFIDYDANGGVDVYQRMAAKIYKKSIDEIMSLGDGVERFVGKQTVLGCGYQTGWRKLQATCARFGVPISDEMAQEAVETFRDTNPKIAGTKKEYEYGRENGIWQNMREASIAAVRNPGHVVNVKNLDGKIRFKSSRTFLRMLLPSGRCVYYPQPKVQWVETPWGEDVENVTYMTTQQFSGKWVRTKTHGAKTVENAVQAISNDIQRDAILRLEDHRYPIVMHTHDDITGEVRVSKNFDQNVLKNDFVMVMVAREPWSRSIPIAAKGWVANRIHKV